MSHHLQVSIPEALEVIAKGNRDRDPLERLSSLEAPTADIGQMLREIELGRR